MLKCGAVSPRQEGSDVPDRRHVLGKLPAGLSSWLEFSVNESTNHTYSIRGLYTEIYTKQDHVQISWWKVVIRGSQVPNHVFPLKTMVRCSPSQLCWTSVLWITRIDCTSFFWFPYFFFLSRTNMPVKSGPLSAFVTFYIPSAWTT